MPAKRSRVQPSQSTQSTQSSSSSNPRPPPAKRAKVASAAQPTTAAAEAAPAAASASTAAPPATASLPAPTKRTVTPGTLRRLSTGHPSQAKGVRPSATLAGAKVGGKSKDLRDGFTKEEMWITRKGLGFGGYLKKGVSAFVQRGCTSLTLHSMGAAIPLALSLGMAIRDALPGGAGDEGAAEADVVDMRVMTGTSVVADEVEPDDEDLDLVYQTRSKSTVSIELSLPPSLAQAIVAGGGVVPGGRGGSSVRGGKRRGGGGGGRGGRGGRGRGA